MTTEHTHAVVSEHSDDAQGPHKTVASPPSTIPVISENRFRSLPAHRRVNTEYIPRAPLFEEDFDPRSEVRPHTHSTLSWIDTFPKKKLEARARILSDWFQGKPEPVDPGVTTHPGDSDSEIEPHRLAPMSHARKNTTSGTGRFSFFGLRRQTESKLDPRTRSTMTTTNDAALDALRDHADMVLRRMQEAYKQRTFAMHQALVDKNDKLEELEETRSRVDHLKSQLDGMAAKVMEQEKAMQAMAEELEQEKQLRRRDNTRSRSRTMRGKPTDDDIPSLVLQTPHRGGKRASHGTLTSDSGFESGDESVADSVFSQREGVESPTSTLTAPSPNLSQVALSTPGSTPAPAVQKNLASTMMPPPPPRSSTYERVIKGLASTRLGSSLGNSSQCSNCHGVPASEAWSVMGVLKDENRGLKTRLGELELVIEDCLCLVGP
ncbi:hypothetical protein NUU61_002212 [Penicillium alfredii]|uniref:Uncharacterized protein n=1 Tax=Penicillium alfredii TaxID=1506179 RepID=A0A9W9KFT2_9EURO|nr:uncharacterized protein NUU61_002212 [Penicillium alfredii]KAJ5104865.1 hypothetical protein NUU61_002212 [Penicillium alfredii]